MLPAILAAASIASAPSLEIWVFDAPPPNSICKNNHPLALSPADIHSVAGVFVLPASGFFQPPPLLTPNGKPVWLCVVRPPAPTHRKVKP